MNWRNILKKFGAWKVRVQMVKEDGRMPTDRVSVADTGGLQWFQLKPPLKICTRCIKLTNGQAGDTFCVTVQVKGFRRLLSANKPIVRLRKATKVFF